MSLDQRAVRRAAILVSALDVQSADDVLDQMPSEDASRVRRAMIDLGDVDADEEEAVIAEFLRNGPAELQHAPAWDDDGVELQLSPAASVAEAAQARPFYALEQIECEPMAALLSGERPTTIALAISRLPAERGRCVIAELPPDLRVEVQASVKKLKSADRFVLQEAERELHLLVDQIRRTPGTPVTIRPRLAETAAIDEPPVQSFDEPPAGALQDQVQPIFQGKCEFADLVYLEDLALAEVFQLADPQVALLALAGASRELMERLTAQLSPRDAKELRRSLMSISAVRLSDVERAQHELALLADEVLCREARLLAEKR